MICFECLILSSLICDYHENVKRGIYFSISPVKRDGIWESYTAFSGTMVCVKELNRKSDKALNEIAAKIEPILEDVVKLYENGAQRDALIKVLTECNKQ